ncbi:MAG: peptidyl-alpha-hydroxyglycine alpha-amidating lyase family protein [Bryobacteraceae bacterium]|nr:peptidyl-alpha-hydroxyglycine alpha-amidating lyase family protein [Bryobacteraceae bacterium]
MHLLFALALAAQPYASQGFIQIPPEVKLGAMSAVEVARDGSIYVLHRGEPPLIKFDSQRKYLKGWGDGMFKVAHGLKADRAGNIWTTDNGNHVLRQFSSDGVLLKTLGEVGIAGPDEKHFRSPDDLVFSSKGDIYVADSGNGRIVHLDPTGKYLGQWGKKGKGEGEFATAHGLAIDRQNRVYVADRGNNRVQVFDSAGKFLAVWNGFGNPFGLLVLGKQLLVSEGDVNKIFHFGLASGKIEEQWGDSQMLQLPHLMSVDRRGNLYVAEVNGKRVQIFRRAK